MVAENKIERVFKQSNTTPRLSPNRKYVTRAYVHVTCLCMTLLFGVLHFLLDECFRNGSGFQRQTAKNNSTHTR